MNIIVLSSIVIAGGVAVIVALSGSSQYNKSSQPFKADKAEWQYETAMEYYCIETGKTREELTQEDADIICERACNHLSMFLTWAIIKGHCGKVHLEEEYCRNREQSWQSLAGSKEHWRKGYCDSRVWVVRWGR